MQFGPYRVLVFQRYEKRNFGWFKTYYIDQMKIHVIKSFYTWIDIIRLEKLRYTQKTILLLEKDVNTMYPTEISLKNKINSGIFRVILVLYENLFFVL